MKWNGTVSLPGTSHINAASSTAAAAQPPIRSRLVVGDAIADIAYRLDPVGPVQLGAEPANADVHDVGARVEVDAPDVVEQLAAAAHLAVAADQVLEQQELPVRQFHLAVRELGPVHPHVE